MSFAPHPFLARRFALAAWLPLFACLCGSVLHAAAPNESATVWTTGDFNGDRELDTVVLGKKSSGRFLQVELSALQLPAFTNSPTSYRLSVRDLDGDSDRDIVLETALREPVAIWLNDGVGNFQENDVDPFRFLLSQDDHREFRALELPVTRRPIGECPNRDAVSFRTAIRNLESPGERLIAGRKVSNPSIHLSAVRTRGPPSLN